MRKPGAEQGGWARLVSLQGLSFPVECAGQAGRLACASLLPCVRASGSVRFFNWTPPPPSNPPSLPSSLQYVKKAEADKARFEKENASYEPSAEFAKEDKKKAGAKEKAAPKKKPAKKAESEEEEEEEESDE